MDTPPRRPHRRTQPPRPPTHRPKGGHARARTPRRAALAQLQDPPTAQPLLVAATGPFIGEGFDCPALDSLFLTAPIALKGRLVQYAGRVMRPHPGKATAEVHDYHDQHVPVLAAALAKRTPGYLSLGFPDPRHLDPMPTPRS